MLPDSFAYADVLDRRLRNGEPAMQNRQGSSTALLIPILVAQTVAADITVAAWNWNGSASRACPSKRRSIESA
jgi:hypothetical protein